MTGSPIRPGPGTVLGAGDVVGYDPGTRHRTSYPGGCMLMVWIEAPIAVVGVYRSVNHIMQAFTVFARLTDLADWCNSLHRAPLGCVWAPYRPYL